MIDWDPNDPDAVKVHYDVSAWSIDQRTELAEALAEAEIAHVWEDDEVVVPEELEAETDELFARLEEVLGPFPVGLEAEDEGVEYGLDEWSPADRDALATALVAGQLPHRWESTTLVVGSDAEPVVDQLLDAIERGELSDAGADPPDGALSTLFTAADRLARDPGDGTGADDLLELASQLDGRHPPFGVSAVVWARTLDAVGQLTDLLGAGDPDPSAVIGSAQELRSLVRPFV